MGYIKINEIEVEQHLRPFLLTGERVELAFNTKVINHQTLAFTNKRIMQLSIGKKKTGYQVIPYKSITRYAFEVGNQPESEISLNFSILGNENMFLILDKFNTKDIEPIQHLLATHILK